MYAKNFLYSKFTIAIAPFNEDAPPKARTEQKCGLNLGGGGKLYPFWEIENSIFKEFLLGGEGASGLFRRAAFFEEDDYRPKRSSAFEIKIECTPQ